MKTIAPQYYLDFHCIANLCKHSCCIGWEIDVDQDSLALFSKHPKIIKHIETTPTPHIRLEKSERCPFLREDGLCDMICEHGEDILCQICRDHPRFRNYWTDIEEIGIGLVCEEAARIILSSKIPMKLITIKDDNIPFSLPEDEQWLWDTRNQLMQNITETGPQARLKEYLIYRYIPDALYDNMLEERIRFIEDAYMEIINLWKNTDGSLEEKIECARKWSYNVEYDDEIISSRLKSYSNNY